MSAEAFVGEAAALETRRKRNVWKSIPWVPAIIILAFVFIAIAAPIFTSYAYTDIDLHEVFLPPAFMEGGNPEHLLGTDALGRDLLTRMFYGARVSLLVALLVVLIGGGVGLIVGMIAGYARGRIAVVLDRLIDMALPFPVILIALLFVVSLGPSLHSVAISISIVLWARFARVIRGEVLGMRDADFISQAKIVGCSNARIVIRHILPNVLNTFMVLVSLQVGWIVIVEATLSFLGAGVPPPHPTWGRLMADGRAYIGSYWWLSIFPGIFIMLLVLSLNLFGNWLRDFIDPRLRQVM